MNTKLLRDFIINLLDDGHGISIENCKQLMELTKSSCDANFNDIWHQVESCEGRAFLNEHDAAELRRVSNQSLVATTN